MSVVSARSARPSRWTAARVSVVWRAFDLQLAVYAALLLCFGLAMAYSNAATGAAPLAARSDRLTVTSFHPTLSAGSPGK